MSGMEPSTISNEEFQRLQNQLLDLRSANYSLMEESNRYKNETRNTIAKLGTIEKEYQRVQRILEKSRKAKDVEMLFAENESLQKKLHNQEEEFRLQNQTLLNELALLVTSNDSLLSNAKDKIQVDNVSNSTQCDISNNFLQEKDHQEQELLQKEIISKDLIIEGLRASMSEEKDQYSKEITFFKAKCSELQEAAEKLSVLTKELEECKKEKIDSENETKLVKQQILLVESDAQMKIEKLQETYQAEIDNQMLIHVEEIKQCEIQIELASAQKVEFEEEAARYRQEAQDALEDARIAERRISSVTADLRRQLRGERKRADKLQERLRDFISDGSCHLPKSEVSIDQDNCSVSSWSLMSGQNDAHASTTPSSPYPTTDSPGSGSDRNGGRLEAEQTPDLLAENSRLVSRLATMQQEKWRLEERVSHLEESNSAMADEMMKRGKLIQHYCMDGRANHSKSESTSSIHPIAGGEKLSVRRMVSLIRQIGSDSDSEADTQRRLQRMLEETLTKNMHLQEDVERLSQEIVRLSQIVGSANLN